MPRPGYSQSDTNYGVEGRFGVTRGVSGSATRCRCQTTTLALRSEANWVICIFWRVADAIRTAPSSRPVPDETTNEPINGTPADIAPCVRASQSGSLIQLMAYHQSCPPAILSLLETLKYLQQNSEVHSTPCLSMLDSRFVKQNGESRVCSQTDFKQG